MSRAPLAMALVVGAATLIIACGGEPAGPTAIDGKGDLNGRQPDETQLLRCCNLYAQIGPSGERIMGAVPYPSSEWITAMTTDYWTVVTLGEVTKTGILDTVFGAQGKTPMIQGRSGYGTAELEGPFNLVTDVTGTHSVLNGGTVEAQTLGRLVTSLKLKAQERYLQQGEIVRTGYGVVECRQPGAWGEPADYDYDWSEYGFAICDRQWLPEQFGGTTEAQQICSHLHQTFPY